MDKLIKKKLNIVRHPHLSQKELDGIAKIVLKSNETWKGVIPPDLIYIMCLYQKHKESCFKVHIGIDKGCAYICYHDEVKSEFSRNATRQFNKYSEFEWLPEYMSKYMVDYYGF